MSATETTAAPVLEEWSPLYPFNKNRYTLRVQTVIFKNSKAGNPMLEFEFEIVNPTAKNIVVDDKGTKRLMLVSGKTVPWWLTFTDKNRKNVETFHTMFGIPVPSNPGEAIDLDPYKSLVADFIVYSDESAQMSDDLDTVTGQKLPILGADGKPIKKHFLRMGDLICKNTTFQPVNPL